MKKYFAPVLLLPLIFSCHQGKTDTEITPPDTTKASVKTDTVDTYKDTHYFWAADFSGKTGFAMIRSRPIPADSLSAEKILQTLNETYPDIKLSFVRMSGDSLFIKTADGNYLANQSGSTGAESYLAEVTYNLTEIKGVNFVHIAFLKGNHASPGTYSRTDFVHE